ncbi:MAG: efflux RND transporter periplasmic adaptor subunit [Candidatus Brocadiia bacterium]
MNKKLIIVIVVITGLVALLASIFGRKQNGNTVFISGTIEATETRMAFQVGGKIKELLKNEGDTARAGELVAQLNKEEFLSLKSQAESALQEAQLNSDRLKADYERAERLIQSGGFTVQQRDTLKANYQMSQARLATLQSGLDLAVLKLGYTDLVAPIDGFITVKSAQIGEIVQPGSAVYTISDLRNLWVTGYIKETDLGRVKLNQKARIKTDSYPDKSYDGYVSFISPESEFTPKQIQTREERINRVYRVKISVDNAGQELKSGMPADVYLAIE